MKRCGSVTNREVAKKLGAGYDELAPGMRPLDVVGPYEVLVRLPGATVQMVGLARGVVRSDNGACGFAHVCNEVPPVKKKRRVYNINLVGQRHAQTFMRPQSQSWSLVDKALTKPIITAFCRHRMKVHKR